MKRNALRILSLLGVWALLAALALGGSAPTALASGRTYFVGLLGSDSNPGTQLRPFRTIQKCASVAVAGDTCAIRPGIYTETVTPRSGVTFQPAGSEPVVISGADPVGGWSHHSGKIYKATVTLNPNLAANQVFVGDTMATEARWPNTGPDLLQPAWATIGNGSTASSIRDPRLPAIDWTGATVHLWSGENPFGHLTAQVTSSAEGTITFPASSYCDTICSRVGGKYYLFGKLAALDTANEWFYDAATSTLYLWAPGGENPSRLLVSAKQRDYAFDLRGVSDVTIRGIRLFASTIVTDAGSANHTIDSISARYLSHFTILGDSFKTNAADSGIVLKGTGHTVRNSTLQYSAGSGVALSDSGHTIVNNLIRDTGYAGAYGTAIYTAPGAGSVTITNNTIISTGRDGISIDWDDARKTFADSEIAFNRVTGYGRLTTDVGGIYACCELNGGANGQTSSIHHNWVHDTGSTLIEGLAVGIYIDNASAGFDLYQNVLWNNRNQGVRINGQGDTTRNNLVRNNSILDGQEISIAVANSSDASGTVLTDNQILAPVSVGGAATGLVQENNTRRAPGATEGYLATVGCDFNGCEGDYPPVAPVGERSVGDVILSSDFDEVNGTVNAQSSFVGGLDEGDWLGYAGLDFGTGGYTTFSASLAVGACCADRRIELRLGSPDGQLIGTLVTRPTGAGEFDFGTYVDQRTAVDGGVSGKQDLYLVFGGGDGAGNLASFTFSDDPPPPPLTRPATARIEAETYDEVGGAVEGTGLGVSGLDDGEWLRFADVDFANPASSFQAFAAVASGGSIEARLDSPDGPLLASLSLQPTGGSSVLQSVALSGTASGVHDLVLVFRGGADIAALNWVRFADDTPPPVRGLATEIFQAESYDAAAGVSDFGPVIGSLDNGDYVQFNGVDFGTGGATSFEALIAVGACCGGRQIEIRLDDPSGRLIGTLVPAATSTTEFDFSRYVIQRTSVENVTGVHNVVLKVAGGNGAGNLDWFRFSAKPVRDGLARIEAESVDVSTGSINNFGSGLGGLDQGDSLRYQSVDFGAGVSNFTASIAVGNEFAGKQIEIRLDAPDGPLVGTLTVQGTGGFSNYVAQSTAVALNGANVTGLHDVVLVFTGGNGVGNLDWIAFN